MEVKISRERKDLTESSGGSCSGGGNFQRRVWPTGSNVRPRKRYVGTERSPSGIIAWSQVSLVRVESMASSDLKWVVYKDYHQGGWQSLDKRVCVSCSIVSDSLQPHGLHPARLPCPWDSPGKNTGVGCHALLQGIFPSQGSNSFSCFLHWQVGSLPVAPSGKPIMKVVQLEIEEQTVLSTWLPKIYLLCLNGCLCVHNYPVSLERDYPLVPLCLRTFPVPGYPITLYSVYCQFFSKLNIFLPPAPNFSFLLDFLLCSRAKSSLSLLDEIVWSIDLWT